MIVDGAPRIAGVARSALLAADLVLIPATPSPLDGWASAEMLRLLDEARVFRPGLPARMVLNRCAARTVIARETAEALAEHDPPVLGTRIGQRVIFADAARTGRLAEELGAADAWVREPDPRTGSAVEYTARLTIDVTPVLRGRIKITAFERGITVAEMLRTLLEREFGEGVADRGTAP